MKFTAHNSDFEAPVRDSFARQATMRLIGARLCEVARGRCTIELPVRDELTQQRKFAHAGIVGMVADGAGAHLRRCGGLHADAV